MRTLRELIKEATIAVLNGKPAVVISFNASRVKVWREGPGLEGMRTQFLLGPGDFKR